MAVNSRESLKQYCLRALGAPVLEINVDNDQLEDRIDEALEFFRQYHPDGIEKIYMKHQITQQDKDNGYIPMSDLVYGVERVLPITTTGSNSKNLFDLKYQLRLNDLYNLTSSSMIYYQTVMNHVAMLDHMLNGHTIYRFNRYQNKLFLDINWQSDVVVGEYIIVECYRAMDPDLYSRVWGDSWLKHYTTALFKKTWATNIKKFDGLQLPGGVTLDGKGLYQEAIDEIKELEDSLMSKSAPLDFFMG